MKCLNCGKQSVAYLCDDCRTEDVLQKLYSAIRYYHPDYCTNPYLKEYVSSLTEKHAERNILPEIFSYYDKEIYDYYYCLYYNMLNDDRLEDASEKYLESHSIEMRKSQTVLYMLLNSYLRKDFEKPEKWCDQILHNENLTCELYLHAAQYYAMVAEYDKAESLLNRVMACCDEQKQDGRLFQSFDEFRIRVGKLRTDIERYRTKKPYWPNKKEAQDSLSAVLQKKGIDVRSAKGKPKKVAEKDFEPIREQYESDLSNYSTFWCESVPGVKGYQVIYQIAAQRIRNGTIIDEFESFIKPWDGKMAKDIAAKAAGVTIDTIEAASDVDIVMKRFFEFVGDDVLVSTDAFGLQAKNIIRLARYSGFSRIQNGFFDLLDYAGDMSDEFSMKNNSREFLLSHFFLTEGRNALEKANANRLIAGELKKLDR